MNNRHAPPAADDPAPVSLPFAVITVTDLGTLTATLNGADVLPSTGEGPWTRARFADLLDVLTQDRGRTVRIEVHETDGTVFTDIIHATRRPAPTGTTEPTKPRPVKKRRAVELVEVTGAGFVPGEDVTVTAVISSAEAGSGGHTRALIDRSQLPNATNEVVLIGRISDTVVFQDVS